MGDPHQPYAEPSKTSKISPASTELSAQKFGYATEMDLMSEFYELMSDAENVETATNYLYESLLDEAILGVVFEIHYSLKTGSTLAMDGEPEETNVFGITDKPGFDIFGSIIAEKDMDCTCPNCNRLVGAAKFAPHLEKCMGMGRNSSRIASRRIASAREGSVGTYFNINLSDDEDDAHWSGDRRKKKTTRSNGSKRNGKPTS